MAECDSSAADRGRRGDLLSPAELEKFRTDNEKGVTVEGIRYTGYEATQMQRSLERAIRRQKRRILVDEAAGDKEKLGQDKTKLAVLHQRYREFSETAGLRTQYERTETAGFGEKHGKNLANSFGRGILKDTNSKGIPITDQAIQRVPQVRPEGWSQEQAERLQEAHRELLRSVQDKPVGTEAGAVYTREMQLIERRSGAAYEVSLPHYNEPHIFVHNHPSGLTFSMADLENFGKRFDLEIMTAIGNDGEVYLLQKTEAYDPVGLSRALLMEQLKLQKIKTPEEYADEINRFLREAEQYGTKFITGG